MGRMGVGWWACEGFCGEEGRRERLERVVWACGLKGTAGSAPRLRVASSAPACAASSVARLAAQRRGGGIVVRVDTPGAGQRQLVGALWRLSESQGGVPANWVSATTRAYQPPFPVPGRGDAGDADDHQHAVGVPSPPPTPANQGAASSPPSGL